MKIVLYAVVLLALVGTLNAQNATLANRGPKSDENQLIRLTHEWKDAISAKDETKLDILMAPNFVLRAWDGSWQAERERWLYNGFHVMNIQAYSAIKAQVFGKVAAVTSNWYLARSVRGNRDEEAIRRARLCSRCVAANGGRWQVVSRTSVVLPGKEPSHSE